MTFEEDVALLPVEESPDSPDDSMLPPELSPDASASEDVSVADISENDQTAPLVGDEGQAPVAAKPHLEIPALEAVGRDDDEAHSAEPAARTLGIRLSKAGQVYFFNDNKHTVRVGSKVLVELEQGQALGEVESILYGRTIVPEEDSLEIGGRVIGLATAQDIAQHAENSILSAEAFAFCKTCIRQRNLDMKLVDVEVLHDRNKIIFFFTAPSRIDFRELVKDLVRNYRTRIELRQIGVRHETQMIGGLGNCGMVCCCHKYLRKFAPVTIKMAKEQNLFLNPAKLSGMCGRLLCCLSFEQGNYESFNKRCPKIGKRYDIEGKGTVKVLRANMFNSSIVFLSDTGEEVEMALEEWDACSPRRAEPVPHEPRPTRGDGERPGHGARKPRPRKESGDYAQHRHTAEGEEPGSAEGSPAGERGGYSRPPHGAKPRKKRRPD